MLRSLVGSEMCIRDRYQRRVRGPFQGQMELLRMAPPPPEGTAEEVAEHVIREVDSLMTIEYHKVWDWLKSEGLPIEFGLTDGETVQQEQTHRYGKCGLSSCKARWAIWKRFAASAGAEWVNVNNGETRAISQSNGGWVKVNGHEGKLQYCYGAGTGLRGSHYFMGIFFGTPEDVDDLLRPTLLIEPSYKQYLAPTEAVAGLPSVFVGSMQQLWELWQQHWTQTGNYDLMADEFAAYYLNIEELRGCFNSEALSIGAPEIVAGLDSEGTMAIKMDQGMVLDALLPLVGQELQQGDVGVVWTQADADADGKVTVGELLDWLNQHGLDAHQAAQAIEQSLISSRVAL
eukprot:TRINITY_DN23113_c0_g1_i1.p1 TRINITY_DN23113_c0_g1~~TRINITY_DN23113_c0_g1_i1.p1  ORF type:complete len:398 (-),score=116.35 TRINITY_DN23113_c0_g1_i1:221-1255(-)